MRHSTFAIFGLINLWLPDIAAGVEPAAANGPVTIAVDVDLGDDRGQSPGSLFEARDAEGRVVAGAGFHDVYNTHFRTNPRTLQFYVRPAMVTEPIIERLPNPELGIGVYLFDIDGQLYAASGMSPDAVRRWDAGAGGWRHDLPPGCRSIHFGDGATRVGPGLLSFSESNAHYDGKRMLAAPDVGAYADFYYANGQLCFYHRHRAESDGFTHIYACPWAPGDGQVDLSRAVVLDTKYDFEATFAWGQWNEQILTVGNSGGVYVFDGAAWRVVREPDRAVSYQVYSMLRRRDRLLLAHYPTGHVFDYQGESPVEIPDWPPRLAGVASSARECQTLAIYSGHLFAGVWPWAELWRLDEHDQWHSHGRLFTHPEITDKTQHPYEAEATQSGVVLNHWGQRISAMVPLHDALYIATSAKGTGPWPENVEFLTAAQRNEYGAVLRLRMPGNLTTPIAWPKGATRLEFVIGPEALSIRQDGVELASTPLEAGHCVDPETLQVTWGDGVHGPLRGTVLRHTVESRVPTDAE